MIEITKLECEACKASCGLLYSTDGTLTLNQCMWKIELFLAQHSGCVSVHVDGAVPGFSFIQEVRP